MSSDSSSPSKRAQATISMLAVSSLIANEPTFDDRAPIEQQLLPHLSAFRYKLLERAKGEGESTDSIALAMLPYALRAAYHAQHRFSRACHSVITAHGGSLSNAPLRLADTAEIGFSVDEFFDAVRRAQNALIPYLGAALRISLPFSMVELVKRLSSEKSPLPEELARPILDYWTGCGRRSKDFRDFAQHHGLVSSEVTLFRGSDGRFGLTVLLPSNPEQKSMRKLVWDRPRIHAQPELRLQMHQLVGLCAAVVKILYEAMPGALGQAGGGAFRLPIEVGRDVDGYAPCTSDEIDANLRRVLEVVFASPKTTLRL